MSDALTSLMRCPQDTVDLAGQMLGRAIQKKHFPLVFRDFFYLLHGVLRKARRFRRIDRACGGSHFLSVTGFMAIV